MHGAGEEEGEADESELNHGSELVSRGDRFSSAALRRSTRPGSVRSMSSASSSPVRAPLESEASSSRHGSSRTPDACSSNAWHDTSRPWSSRDRHVSSKAAPLMPTHPTTSGATEGSARAGAAPKQGTSAPPYGDSDKRSDAREAERQRPPFVCGIATPKIVHADLETPFEALASPKSPEKRQAVPERRERPMRPRRDPPAPDASLNARMQFIHYQLDCFSERHTVLNGLSLLRTGAKQRFQSGAAPRHCCPAMFLFVFRTACYHILCFNAEGATCPHAEVGYSLLRVSKNTMEETLRQRLASA